MNQQQRTGSNSRCIVVGGGTAGWLTASHLKSVHGNRLEVLIIDPSAGGHIGVGESTLPTIHRTLAQLGIDWRRFMQATDATIKQGIHFKGWQTQRSTFYHPYDFKPHQNHREILHRWLLSNKQVPFAELATSQVETMRAAHSPFALKRHGELEAMYGHSLHVDATQVIRFLQQRSDALGITHLRQRLVQVQRGSHGIEQLTLANGQKLSADLYIDCSGFQRLLSCPEQNWKRFHYLPCNRAISASLPHQGQAIAPYTSAHAHSGGWIWDIPLYSRRGIGCVYSSEHLSEAKALQQFEHTLGFNADGLELRSLEFEPGYLQQPWCQNVLCIGLSAGFVEPLESTGIYFIEEALDLLAGLYPFSGWEWPQQHFNQLMRTRYQECAEFVYLHYRLSKRTDSSFWNEFQRQGHGPESVEQALEFWRAMPPNDSQFNNGRQLFARPAHEYILYGMGFEPDLYAQDLKQAPRYPNKNDRNSQGHRPKPPERLMGHREFLDVLHGTRSATDVLCTAPMW